MAFCGAERRHPNETQAQLNNPIPEYQPRHQNYAVIEAEQGIQHEGQMTGVQVMNNGYVPVIGEPNGDYNDCFRVVRKTKHVEIPCTRNEYQRYKVKVPKQVNEQVQRRVQYTDYETRERKEPYSVKRFETAYREEDQPYTIQVPKKVTRMVKVTKKVPKTVYVNVVVEEPREETIMVPETRTRLVKVPYQKEVFDQQYRTVEEKVPVTKFRTEYDTIVKTIYEDSWRTEVVPVTKIVHKDIPVYQVVRNEDCANCDQVDVPLGSNNHEEPAMQLLPESNYNDHMKPNVETYPPYVETHPQHELTDQFAPQYEPQSVNHGLVMHDPNLTPVMQHAGPVQVMQPETALMKDAVLVNNYEPAPLANASEYHYEQKLEKSVQMDPPVNALDEQKVEKFGETTYTAPVEYDSNKDGILDTQEREEAIAVVENPEGGEAVVQEPVVQEPFSQPARQSRTRKKKSGGRRRRRNRRK